MQSLCLLLLLALHAYTGFSKDASVTTLGSDYGGWTVDIDRLHAGSIVYSFGLGRDITFDRAIISKRNCTVFGFDNTPISSQYIKSIENTLPVEFRWVKLLLWTKDTILTMALPKAHGVSMTSSDITVKDSRFEHSADKAKYKLPARSLHSIMRMLGHHRLEVLKLDIEGAEFPIIEDWHDSRTVIPVCQLLLETHERFYKDEGEAKVAILHKQLVALGFKAISHKGSFAMGHEWLYKHPLFCRNHHK